MSICAIAAINLMRRCVQFMFTYACIYVYVYVYIMIVGILNVFVIAVTKTN